MASLNVVTLIGNATRKPEVRTVGQNNTSVADVGLAVNRKFGDQEEVSFFDVVCWGKTAEIAGDYIDKGSQIAVVGRLKQESWETQEGEKRSKVVIVCENLQLLGSKKAASEEAPKEDKAPARRGRPAKSQGSAAPPPQDDDGVPFAPNKL